MTDVVPVASAAARLDLDDKYRIEEGRIYLTGIQALVRVPLDQMRRDRRAGLQTGAFIAGYPGSPVGGYDQELIARRKMLDELGVVHRPGLNEELAATAVMGSQTIAAFDERSVDGVLGIWYGKAPGLDRASDALRHANFNGTTIKSGALVICGDDPACKSSSIPNSSTHLLADLKMPVLFPGNVQEVLDLGLHGVALSRASALWVGMKVQAIVADGAGTADVGPDRIAPVLPVVEVNGVPFVRETPPGLSPRTVLLTESELHGVRLEIARQYGTLNGLNPVTHDVPDAWLGIMAVGTAYYDVIGALHQLGVDDEALRRFGIRIMRVGMPHPLDPGHLRAFARGLAEIFVVEEKQALVEPAVRDALYRSADQPLVVGKRDDTGTELVRSFGALDADLLVEPLRRRVTQRIDASLLRPPPDKRGRVNAELAIIPRTPYFCSGCPHNTSLRTPKGASVGAGIGCHSMVAFLDSERAGNTIGVTQMGGEGSQWIGMQPFVGTKHIFQNLGDGTFFHSGSLSVRHAVANGVNITFKLLFNRAVAMTGGQDPVGAQDAPSVARLLMAEGVKRVIITTEELSRYRRVSLPAGVDVWDRSRILKAQETLAAIPGTTVLIHDQQCAAEARRLRKRGELPDPPMRVVIAERVCEGCGDCGVQSNCLSLQPTDTEFGLKTAIEQSSCNKDYSCINGDCPSFLTLMPRSPGKSRKLLRHTGSTDLRTRRAGADLRLDEAPAEPQRIVNDGDFTVRMPGIGGTGVVTVAQILGTAALLDGRHVAGADQTGLSQKGGAVVSDVRISREPVEASTKLAAGSLDLYLAFDIIGAVSPANISAATPDRTVAVVSTTKSATGLMIGRPNLRQPSDEALRAVIDETTSPEHNVYVDAGRVSTALFGRATTANILLVGVAYQQGTLPVSATAIEQAIELNGVAVEANLRAFRWGRLWVLDRPRVEAAMQGSSVPSPVDEAEVAAMIGDLDHGELGRLLRIRVADLIDYQSKEYAERYLRTMRVAAAAEARSVPGSTAFSEAVARWFYKLLAYKDEYEVARLHLLDSDRAAIDAAANGEDVKVSWNLHPPMFRSIGLDRKLRVGPWFRPAFVALRSMKRLRGTPFDVFGYARVRRVERRLVNDYERAIVATAGRLSHDTLPFAVQLASLPDMVRGYEHVKLDNVELYEGKLAELVNRVAAGGAC